MKRFPIVPLCVLCLGLAILYPAFAKEPTAKEDLKARLKKAPTADLLAEAKDQIEALKTLLDSEEVYKEKTDEIRRTASLLRMLGQFLFLHPDSKEHRWMGTNLVGGAVRLLKSDNFAAAKKAQARLDEAFKPQTEKRDPENTPWKELVSMEDMMHIVNERNSQVRRAARRSRKPEEDSRNAQTIALLSLVMAEKTEHLKTQAEKDAWKKFALDYQQGMADVARAFKEKDKDGIQKHLALATKACNDCHAQFRDGE